MLWINIISDESICFVYFELKKPILNNYLSRIDNLKISIFFLLHKDLDKNFSVSDFLIKNKLIFFALLDITAVDNSIILDIPPIFLSSENTENIFFSKFFKELFIYTIKT